MAAIEISPSNLEKNIQEDTTTQYQRRSSRRSSRNDELDDDQLSRLQRQNRWLKWATLLFGAFSLLSIAALVGMIYSVDSGNGTEVSSGSPVLLSKDTGTPVGTNQIISKNRADRLYMMSPDQLEKIQSITVPEGNGYRIARVSSIYLLYNESATVTTTDGKIYEITRDGFFVPGGSDSTTSTTPTTTTPTVDISTGPIVVTGRRKLLDVGGNGAMVTSHGYVSTNDPMIKGAPEPGPSYIPCNYYCQANCTTTFAGMPMDLQICKENCDVNCQNDYPLSACIYQCSNECSNKYPGDSCALNKCNGNCKTYCEGEGYVDQSSPSSSSSAGTSSSPPPPPSSPEMSTAPAPSTEPIVPTPADAPGPSTDYAPISIDYAVGDYSMAPEPEPAAAAPSPSTSTSPPATSSKTTPPPAPKGVKTPPPSPKN